MDQLLEGIINGRTIELLKDPGFPQGRRIVVRLEDHTTPLQAWGEGLRQSAGAAANMPDSDALLEQLERERKNEKYREERA